MADETQMVKLKIDHKFAAYAFMIVIFCSIFSLLVIGALVKSSGADLKDFWESSVASIIRYAMFFAVFFIVCRQLRLKGREIPRAVDLNTKISWWNLGLVIFAAWLVLVSFMLLGQGVVDIMVYLGYKPQSGTAPDNIPQYIMAIFTLCLLPAVIEELLFRGFILKGFLPAGKTAAVIASALLFTLFHLNPEQTVYQFLLGVILALVALKTGNILYCMILHFLNNFIVVTTYTFFGDPMINLTWNPLSVCVCIGLALLGAAMILGVCRILKQHGDRAEVPKTVKFFTFDNIGFFVSVALGTCIWMLALLG